MSDILNMEIDPDYTNYRKKLFEEISLLILKDAKISKSMKHVVGAPKAYERFNHWFSVMRTRPHKIDDS